MGTDGSRRTQMAGEQTLHISIFFFAGEDFFVVVVVVVFLSSGCFGAQTQTLEMYAQ